jgi:fumarylacetoacetase
VVPQQLNYFESIELTDDMFMQDTLNDFILMEKTWRLVRNRIAELLMLQTKLQNNAKDLDIIILEWKMSKCNYQY